MNDKARPRAISRRDFLKGFGTGLVGSSLLLPQVGKARQADNERMREFLNSGEPVTITINGSVVRAIVEPRTTLATLLRNHLELTGTKIACNQGHCGACTVVLDGEAIYSCHTLALDAHGKEVITVEGLMTGEELHPLQEAFIEEDGLQCGYCTPGQIMSAYALLLEEQNPSDEHIKLAVSGNLCRCAAYPHILASVRTAAEKMRS